MSCTTGVPPQGVAENLDAYYSLDRFNWIVGKVGDPAVASIDTVCPITSTSAADHWFDDLNIWRTAFRRLGNYERNHNPTAGGWYHVWQCQAECAIEQVIDADGCRMAHAYRRRMLRIDE